MRINIESKIRNRRHDARRHSPAASPANPMFSLDTQLWLCIRHRPQKTHRSPKRVSRSRLDSGALVGELFSIDRVAIAEDLSFDGTINNSMAAVAEQSFVIEALQWSATVVQHISRRTEDLICIQLPTSASTASPTRIQLEAVQCRKNRTRNS